MKKDVARNKTGSGATAGNGELLRLPLAILQFGDSPRLAGQNREYTEQLAESEAQLPPILVNRWNMQVVDGVHRVLAAALRGQETIEAVLVNVSREDAFLLAVESNTRHGLPLSQADRKAAAARLVASHPHMSDRAIARASGLGAGSVATIRRSTAPGTQLNARVGADGRVRPLDPAAGRQRAADVVARNPSASLREVARQAGISPATASDVRRRLLAGESIGGTSVRPAAAAPQPQPEPAPAPRHGQESEPRARPASLLEQLLHDPALRGGEVGRRLLHLMRVNIIGADKWFELAEAVPAHCSDLVMALAQQNADTWLEFAQALDEQEVSAPPAVRTPLRTAAAPLEAQRPCARTAGPPSRERRRNAVPSKGKPAVSFKTGHRLTQA